MEMESNKNVPSSCQPSIPQTEVNTDQNELEQISTTPQLPPTQSEQKVKEKEEQQTKRPKTNDEIFKLVLQACKNGQYKMKLVPIDLWDFGGQKIYYMTHQLFISSRGIYIIIFNGSKDINKDISDLSYLPGQYGKRTTAGNIKYYVHLRRH